MIFSRQSLTVLLGTVLCLFTLAEVNYPHLTPQSQLAIFALFGLVLCFLHYPLRPGLEGDPIARAVDIVLALGAVSVCSYVVVQNQPWFEGLWIGGSSLGSPFWKRATRAASSSRRAIASGR